MIMSSCLHVFTFSCLHVFKFDTRDMPERKTIVITRGVLWGSLIVLLIAVLCIRLGLWQLDRLEERRARNQAIRERMELPPIQLSPITTDTNGLIFRRAVLRGEYDNAHAIVIAGRAQRGVPGVHVLTPMRLGGAAVLVNRGWMPSADAARIEIDSIRESSPRNRTALLTPMPDDRGSGATSDTFQRIWYSMDPERLRRQFPYPVLPVVAQILPHEGQPRYPIRLRVPEMSEGPHMGYAIQWFSFAAIAMVGWILLLRRRG